MGELERKVQKRVRRGKLEHAVLATLVIAGVLALGAVAPSAGAIFKLFEGDKRRARARRQGVQKAIHRLQDKGLIEFKPTPKGNVARITERGRYMLLEMESDISAQRAKKRTWDKKWRIVVFDVPEYRRGVRDRLRNALRNIGFYQLQRSVWVFPYDCEDLVALLKADFRIGKDVLYVVADEIESDAKLRQRFGLTRGRK